MYEIIRIFNEPHNVTWAANGNGLRLSTCGDSRIFMRVAMRTSVGETARWLVGEMASFDKDGNPAPVYLYAERDSDNLLHLVMTKEVMSP